MIGSVISPFLDAVTKINSVKKVETILPIARKVAHVTPLLVGDDLSLRTSLTSPVGYDREMIQILYNHHEFVEEDKNVKYKYQQFCQEVSNIDKISLLWALYRSTYDTLGSKDRKMTCPKDGCKSEFTNTIYLEDLVHEDTYFPWAEELQFHEFVHPIIVNYEAGGQTYVYEFLTRLPSIQNNNQLLSMISIDVLQKNLEAIGSIFTKPQQMSLLTKAIRISSTDGSVPTAETADLTEMLMAFQNHIPYIVSEEFFDKYNEQFSKYIPKYYKELECPMCKHKWTMNVDIELEFFRRCLFGGGKSE